MIIIVIVVITGVLWNPSMLPVYNLCVCQQKSSWAKKPQEQAQEQEQIYP